MTMRIKPKPASTSKSTGVTSGVFATLHAADLHVGGFRFAFNYLERTETALNQMLATITATAKTVKHLVFTLAGDLVHLKFPTERERALVHRFVSGVCAIPNIEFILLEGNHDYYDHDGFTMLHAFGEFRTHMPNLRIVTGKPRVITYDFENTSVSYMCVPCQQHLTTADMQAVLARMRKTARGEYVYAVIHECFIGSSNESGYAYKSKLELPEDDGVDGYLLGDIHMRQQLGKRAFYCGSPWQTRFDEVDAVKGVLLWHPGVIVPEFVQIKGVPRLIETLLPEHARKFANTEHTVRYIGRTPLDFTAPNVSWVPKLLDKVDDDPKEGVVAVRDTDSIRAVTHVDLTHGLKGFCLKKKLDDADTELGVALVQSALEAA